MAKKAKKASKRGLRGTPAEHVVRAEQHLHAARRPVSFGCRAAIESLGAAKSEISWANKYLERDPSTDDQIVRAFRVASKAIEEHCSCSSTRKR